MISNTTSKHPIIFDEFFQLGLQESVSPFLTPSSRSWGINLSLKASFLAAILLVVAFILQFFDKWVPLSNIFILVVYFLAGIPALIEAVEDLTNLEINIDVLMTLAAFSAVLIGSAIEGALLLVLFALSGAIEESVTRKAESAITSLNKLVPTKACVIDSDGTILERAIQDVRVGAHILIKSGQAVPLDGRVIEGTSSVNLVHLTGENQPVTKKVGDEVAAGSRNLEGALIVNVTHTSADSTVTRIIQLVTEAQEARPKLQRWFDKMSEGYAIGIILLATLVALFFPFFFDIPYIGFEGSIYRAVAFLIAASPCALILAIPIAYLSAISVCAQKGILLKGGITLDALSSCSTIAFDKTGTLTTGNLICLGMESLRSLEQFINSREVLSIAVAMERNTVHPIAKAILDFSTQESLVPVRLREFRTIPGYGLEAVAEIGDRKFSVYIGHLDYIHSNLSIETQEMLKQKIERIQFLGELMAVLYIYPDNSSSCLGIEQQLFLFRFSDTLRPKIRDAIQALKNEKKWRLLMLTGDHENSARSIAESIGIEEYHANLRPEDKLRWVTELAPKGLAMVGDGINDAPALARATVGICMGKVGSATAMEAADVILLQDNLEYLKWLMDKAESTQRIVKQNLITAVAAIAIASLPAMMGWIPLWLAVIAHEGGTVLVGLNALRLLKK